MASSSSVLVNKRHPLKPKQYVPTPLAKVAGGAVRLRKDAATHAESMFAAADKTGITIRARSGYRSYDTQSRFYRHYTATYGRAKADSLVARPGYSEHQTGLAVDVGYVPARCPLQSCFGQTPLGRWVAQNGYRYGFIVRYPKGATAITGYAYEPWHLRYVGVAVASDMRAKKISTLERYAGYGNAPRY